jgi:PTS system nitrogen regulatory IIA component
MNLSVRDVAKHLNVSEKTIYRMIKDEMIPCFRVGGQWRFDSLEINSLDRRCQTVLLWTATGKTSEADEETISVTEFLKKGGLLFG